MPETVTAKDAAAARVFISYKRDVHPDDGMAAQLARHLKSMGVEVFFDRYLPLGKIWDNEVESALDRADYVVTVVSKAALGSQNVSDELSLVRKRWVCMQDRLQIVPIWMCTDLKLPLQFQFLERMQGLIWKSESDTASVVEALTSRIRGSDASPVDGVQRTPRRRGGGPLGEMRQLLAAYAPGVEPLDDVMFTALAIDALHRRLLRALIEYSGMTDAIRNDLDEISTEATAWTQRVPTKGKELVNLLCDVVDVAKAAVTTLDAFEAADAELEEVLEELRGAAADYTPTLSDPDSKLQQFFGGMAGEMRLQQRRDTLIQANENRKRQAHSALLRGYEMLLTQAQQAAEYLDIAAPWTDEDAGLEQPVVQRFTLAKKWSQGSEACGKAIEDMLRSRPHDPFLRMEAYQLTRDSVTDATKSRRLAERMAGAVLLVPPGPLYDSSRAELLFTAVDSVSLAFSTRQAGQLAGTVDADSARHALRLLDAFERLYPLWPDPDGKRLLYRIELLGGSNQLQEALDLGLQEGSKAWDAPNAAYNIACYASVLGNTDVSWKWFERAVRDLGWNSIEHAKSDPDLARLRAARKTDWDRLLQPHLEASIVHCLVDDDITLTNKSAYPITNVRVTAYSHLVQGSWNTVNLHADRIDCGETKSWSDVVSVPGMSMKISELKCEVWTDQFYCRVGY